MIQLNVRSIVKYEEDDDTEKLIMQKFGVEFCGYYVENAEVVGWVFLKMD